MPEKDFRTHGPKVDLLGILVVKSKALYFTLGVSIVQEIGVVFRTSRDEFDDMFTVQLIRQVAQKVTHRGFFFALFDDVDNRISVEVQDFPVQLFEHLVQPQSRVCSREGCQEDVGHRIFAEVTSGISPVHLHQVLANDMPVQDFFVRAAENPQKFCFF